MGEQALREQLLAGLREAADDALPAEDIDDAETIAVGVVLSAYRPDIAGVDRARRMATAGAITIIRQAREIEALRAALAESREVEW